MPIPQLNENEAYTELSGLAERIFGPSVSDRDIIALQTLLLVQLLGDQRNRPQGKAQIEDAIEGIEAIAQQSKGRAK